MGREIERKFLVAGEAWRRLVVRKRELLQGYLANTERTSVRVRTSGLEAWLNIKSGALTAARDEFEYAIPISDANELLAAVAQKPIIEKTRHWVPYGEFEWEIDVFHGGNDGLVVAEIELDFEEQNFPLPAWIGKEVTDLARYYNVNLVGHPYSSWDERERSA
jgi:adenylate cyclase